VKPNEVRTSDLCRLLAAMRPCAALREELAEREAFLRDQSLTVCCQHRIENDWQEYTERRLRVKTADTDDLCLTFDSILEKVKRSFPELTDLFGVYNADGLPTPEAEMKSAIASRFGIRLWSKADTGWTSTRDFLADSLIDFELAVDFDCFIANSRSTFGNIVVLTSSVRRSSSNSRCYLYNAKSELLVERTDHGLFVIPQMATSPVPIEQPRDEPGDTHLARFLRERGGTPKTGWSARFPTEDRVWAQLAPAMEEAFGGTKYPPSAQATVHDCLAGLLARCSGGVYCEIGVEHGHSLRLAANTSLRVGVDPKLRVKQADFERSRLVATTSDTFFESEAATVLSRRAIDLALIDGMRVFELALRDFIGLERHSHREGVVALPNVLPRSNAEASRVRVTRSWTGDVWRVVYALRRFRPDLNVTVYDALPAGLAVITQLDPASTLLMDRYDEVVAVALALTSAQMMANRDALLEVQPATSLLPATSEPNTGSLRP
jgi:hypothetical protein